MAPVCFFLIHIEPKAYLFKLFVNKIVNFLKRLLFLQTAER